MPKGALSRLLGERDWWEYTPIWSPDNSEIIYATNKNNRHTLLRRRMRDGVETSVYSSLGTAFPTDWSPDGKYILFGTDDRVWILNLSETGAKGRAGDSAGDGAIRGVGTHFRCAGWKVGGLSSASQAAKNSRSCRFDQKCGSRLQQSKFAVSPEGGSEPV